MTTETFDYKKSTEEDLFEVRKCKIKILMLQEKNEELCQANNEEINRLGKIIENKIKHTNELLTQYKKETGEKKIDISQGGWTHFRAMPDEWIYGDNAIDEVKSIYPEDTKRYIKISESLIKKNVKEDILSGKIALPSVTTKPQDPKFEYKLPGGGDLL